jgi:hypothetical protein
MPREAEPAGAEPGATESLPVWLTPLPDEALFGLGLRLDEANGFPSGTTAKATARYSAGPLALANPALQYLGTAFDLGLLGALTNADDTAAEALTYRRELRALFGPRATARNIGDNGGFRICRRCVGERRLLTRLTTLPGVRMCPDHRLLLATACGGCDRRLRPFAPWSRPFACRCGFDWADGPVTEPTPHEALVQDRAIAAYRDILATLPKTIVRAAERIAQHRGPRRWTGGSEDPSHRPADLLIRTWYGSLAAIVALLVDRDLPARALTEVMRSQSPTGAGCHNRACLAGPGEIRLNGRRKGHAETYCRECGSRFLGRQVIESYDFGHSDPRLSEQSVRNARNRLVRRQVAVAEAARELRAVRPTGLITVSEVFAVAGVSTARNLRARRLRLVSIAQAVLRGRHPVTNGPIEPDPNRWRDHLPDATSSGRAGGGRRVGPKSPRTAGGIGEGSAGGLETFLARFPDEAACVTELRARRWSEGFRCPACDGTRSTLLRNGRLWHCSSCDLQTSVMAGTLPFGSSLPLRDWLAAAYVLAADPAATGREIAAQLGVPPDTGRFLRGRINRAIHSGAT